ncbi:MAG: glycosyltransferase [Rhodospirillales bacterium]|nr:glycosyltransferase [Rhodospirillales bacterium]
MTKTIVLSQHALTVTDQERLNARHQGEVEFLVVSNIVHTGYFELLRILSSYRCDQLVIFIASAQDSIMVPIYRLMAGFIRADKRFVLFIDGEAKRYSAFVVIRDLFSIALSLFTGLATLLWMTCYVFSINRSGRVRLSRSFNLKSKRILYLRPTHSHGLRTGGAASHSQGIVRAFLNNGFNVVCAADDEIIDIPDGQGETLIVESRRSYVVPRELNNMNFQWAVLSIIRNRLGETFQGIIYQRLGVFTLAGLISSRFWRVPLIIEYNGSESWLARNWGKRFFFDGLIKYFERSILAHAHMIVTVSDVLKRDLIARGIPEDRVLACPNGVDAAKFTDVFSSESDADQLREKLGFDEDDLIFTFVGSFGIWHGATLLAEAINEILEEQKASPASSKRYKFMFIGNGVEYPQVLQILREAIDEKKVVMTNQVSNLDVVKLLSISDICVAPTLSNSDGSEFFGSPTKLFEYLAAGKPVIAGAVGQVRAVMHGSLSVEEVESDADLSADQRNKLESGLGILFRAGDRSQLKRAIYLTGSNDRSMQIIGRRARDVALRKYTWDGNVKLLIKTFCGVTDREVNRRVKIFINGLHSKSGGGVTYLRNMLPKLVAMPNLDVHVMLHKKQQDIFAECLPGATVHYSTVNAGLAGVVFAEQVQLPRVARRVSADVVFSLANYGPLFVRNGMILIRNSLDVATVERRALKLCYWALIYLATMASILTSRRAIAVSTYARNVSFRGPFRKLRRKVTIIPHGISPVFFDVERKPVHPDFILTVSDIYVQKNLHTLIRGFASILNDHPGLLLKVAGQSLDPSYFARLERLISELGIQDSVQFLGHVESDVLLELYASCALFVFPSTVETFGNPLVEAMASGCPIVCSDAAAMPEIAGDSVVFVDPKTPEEIANAISQLLSDEEKKAKYSASARNRAKMFSWDVTAEKTVIELQHVAETR